MKKRIYLLERIKDSADWEKGMKIYAEHPCKGWRVIAEVKCE